MAFDHLCWVICSQFWLRDVNMTNKKFKIVTVPLKSKLPPSHETRIESPETRLPSLERRFSSRVMRVSSHKSFEKLEVRLLKLLERF